MKYALVGKFVLSLKRMTFFFLSAQSKYVVSRFMQIERVSVGGVCVCLVLTAVLPGKCDDNPHVDALIYINNIIEVF